MLKLLFVVLYRECEEFVYSPRFSSSNFLKVQNAKVFVRIRSGIFVLYFLVMCELVAFVDNISASVRKLGCDKKMRKKMKGTMHVHLNILFLLSATTE